MYKIPSGTLFLGKNLLVVPECPSTNTLAAELAQAGKAPEGTTVITHHQTAGRGQRGNTWESGKGLNLTFSVVLNPVFLKAGEQFLLNKTIALSIHDVVKKYTSEPVRIKWPNDIMIGDKKVCGILIENQLAGEKISRSIIGIGLNVNQKEFPTTLGSSLSLHSSQVIGMEGLFEELLQSIEWRYLEGRRQEPGARSREDYLGVLYRVGEKYKYIIGDSEVDGVIRGVDHNGKLIVEIEGQERTFDLKEIKYVY